MDGRGHGKRQKTHRKLWSEVEETGAENSRCKESEKDKTTDGSITDDIFFVCETEIQPVPKARGLNHSPGNLATAASLSIANTLHIIRGQERADANIALNIFSTKNSKFAYNSAIS